ncbi:mercuric reductase [Candidatus Pacearchaeota archaeon CG10_big_fil_rev_8_21_14_0_10_31_9]|nr:MAG: mercuric reductase [Candidatus Pacearchaeota archaeon CG10_big_fil_rev_8_21_14_0_10_31_9]PIZ82734.1 MAG: mercuric reductase [Candidatus Pacearchaeota archaeon CG_4_10_14_0_2_um_filter_05_32_18]
MKTYDIIVIGAGSGGLNIAGFMNKAGFKVLLVDKSDTNIGGDCLNFGCVPSKALIHVAKIISNAKLSGEFGIFMRGKINMRKVTDYVKQKQDLIREHENALWFRKQGMDIELGEAEFVGKDKVKVNDKIFSGKRIVIATGSKPSIPKIEGIEKIKNTYTNETIFNLNNLPKNLVIIGGGPIGMELGQAFLRLGSKVTIVQRGAHFLPKEDPEISKILQEQLVKEGIHIHLDCEPVSFQLENSLTAKTKSGKLIKINFDAVLLAVGRELNIPKGLEKAGVNLTEDGKKIKVNDYLQTTNKKIYLCGDIAGGYQFTHATELHASVILNNFFSPLKKKLSYDNFSWVTYTDPEIATFGLNEEELTKRNIKYKKLIQNYEDVDRGIVDNSTGKLIIYISRNNKILGGSFISSNAGEIFQELSLAMSSKLNIKNIFDKIYPYPTASRINKKIVNKIYSEKLTKFSKRLLKLFYYF